MASTMLSALHGIASQYAEPVAELEESSMEFNSCTNIKPSLLLAVLSCSLATPVTTNLFSLFPTYIPKLT